MFARRRLIRSGVSAKALVLDKKVYASGYSTGRTKWCRYTLRVQFPDGTTSEIRCWAWRQGLARARVGEVIPVRCDPADRTKIAIDGDALEAHHAERERELKEQAVANGERELEK